GRGDLRRPHPRRSGPRRSPRPRTDRHGRDGGPRGGRHARRLRRQRARRASRRRRNRCAAARAGGPPRGRRRSHARVRARELLGRHRPHSCARCGRRLGSTEVTEGSRRRLAGSLVGAAALITAVTVLSRILGFVRWVAQAGTVGYDAVGTAYASANTVPNVLFVVIAGGALAGALVPLLAVPLARGLRAETDRTASAALTWALVALAPVALLVLVLAEPVARALAPD